MIEPVFLSIGQHRLEFRWNGEVNTEYRAAWEARWFVVTRGFFPPASHPLRVSGSDWPATWAGVRITNHSSTGYRWIQLARYLGWCANHHSQLNPAIFVTKFGNRAFNTLCCLPVLKWEIFQPAHVAVVIQ